MFELEREEGEPFVPERGQLYWYIEEVFVKGFPDLRAMTAKFDPALKIHQDRLARENCFWTEIDAYMSLMGEDDDE